MANYTCKGHSFILSSLKIGFYRCLNEGLVFRIPKKDRIPKGTVCPACKRTITEKKRGVVETLEVRTQTFLYDIGGNVTDCKISSSYRIAHVVSAYGDEQLGAGQCTMHKPDLLEIDHLELIRPLY